jgi:putative Holliday junction resolvase
MHKRLLGIDYGDVRIGVAISDPLGLTAQPVGTIQNSPTAITEIQTIIHEKKVTKVIVGLPKNQHGDDSKKAASVRSFADKLMADLNIEMEFVDERFSTVAVSRHLISMDIKRQKRKSVIDTQAAMFILQGVLDRKS